MGVRLYGGISDLDKSNMFPCTWWRILHQKKVIRNGYHISRGGDYTHGGEDVYSIITGLVMVVNGDELWK